MEENFAEKSFVLFTRILSLLEKDPRNSNSEESSENRETFSGSKFSPATGVSRMAAVWVILFILRE